MPLPEALVCKAIDRYLADSEVVGSIPTPRRTLNDPNQPFSTVQLQFQPLHFTGRQKIQIPWMRLSICALKSEDDTFYHSVAPKWRKYFNISNCVDELKKFSQAQSQFKKKIKFLTPRN